ncbi:MAG TPA: DUF924 family protein [Reyranellaceae bacterium]|nr:DUF924 family protein [Reyranellaceae bacterium]
MTDTNAIRDILDFWFLPKDHPDHAKPREIWWKSTPAFDEEIRRRFGKLIERGAAGELASWLETPEGALALIILCDQFTRNIFRKTPKAYSGDATALAAARIAVARGYPQALPRIQRTFLYTPFHHSEALADQEMSCALFDTIADPEQKNYARGHRDVVARFGRFPHRNEVLGRTSTAEEIEFLKTAERYGQ